MSTRPHFSKPVLRSSRVLRSVIVGCPMDDHRRQQFDWLPGSPWLKPDWRLRRARHLAETGGSFDPDIDDIQVERAVAEFRRVGRRHGARPRKRTTLQAVLSLAGKPESPLRWRLEALLLTDCPLSQIGAVLKLPERFISAYHAMVFDVRPRRRATDWLIRFAMGRPRFDTPPTMRMEYAWKFVACSGGTKMLDATVAITTGAPFPAWIQASFVNPPFDDARLRLSGKLAIGAMIATTREEWRALVNVRRQLRRIDPTYERGKPDERLQIMESQLATLVTYATLGLPTKPMVLTPKPRGGIKDDQPFETARPASGRRATGGGGVIRVAAPSTSNQTEGGCEEASRDEGQTTDPLAFLKVEIHDSWNSFDPTSPELTVETGRFSQ